MNPGVYAYAQIAVITVVLVASLCATGVITGRAMIRSKQKARQKLGASDERIEQLQQSVDAIALEVERIAEAQRFTAKLLAERSQPSSIAS